jgi:HK97 family phage portal protein
VAAEPGLLARLRSMITRAFAPGGPAGPINWTQHGGLPVSWPVNYWQKGLTPYQGGESATVNACVNAYAQTLAQMPGTHYQATPEGGQVKITTSALSRILRTPNPYQTRSDFVLNLVTELLFTGNAYAVAIRNARQEVDSLHPIASRGTQGLIDEDSGAIFYALGVNVLAGRFDYAVPARDVLHVRCRTQPGYPLLGITPLRWAAMAQAANVAISATQATFFANASQPSGFLSTKETLTGNQLTELRAAWAARAAGIAQGEVPILGGGMEFQAMGITSQDAQLVEAFGMTVGDIARAYGVPLPIIGDLSTSRFHNTEQLLAFWLSTALGFYVEHLEVAFDRFFGLPADQFTEFDTDTLLRTAFNERIDGLTKGITGGLYSPDEARAKEGLPAVPDGFGAEPRLQAQVVPLSQVGATPVPSAPAAPAAPVDPAAADPGLDTQATEQAAATKALEQRVEALHDHLGDLPDMVRNAVLETVPRIVRDEMRAADPDDDAMIEALLRQAMKVPEDA